MDISASDFSIKKIWHFIRGGSRDPFNPEIFRHIALISFLAWVGLGADGLSSACYGPEEAYLALGKYTHLALYIAIATAVTVFIISLSYNQVVELFPSGGGGYKVATQLLGSYAGLVSGAALIVDYILTIAISIASGTDAFFSFLPLSFQAVKDETELLLVALLLILNLRGLKESVIILLPIFLGFVATHFILIIYGITSHQTMLPQVVSTSINETYQLVSMIGGFAVAAFLLHSYSLGSGTYTGLEAVSNNVNRLAEPKVKTGKLTMLYMAISLSIMASGIILLYLLWGAYEVPGKTLNAMVFGEILHNIPGGNVILVITLCLEAGILLIAANTGFIAGPMVLANMSVDGWVPNRFRHLSSRLVIQNGVIIFGIAAAAILLLSGGEVSWLIILYSINVFLTFTLTLLGLCTYWAKGRSKASKNWIFRLSFSLLGLIITGGILITTVLVKFTAGGYVTVIITSIVIFCCILIKRHYTKVAEKLAKIDQELAPRIKSNPEQIPALEPQQPTAVFFVSSDISVGMHTLLWCLRMFPNHFKNFIFVSVGVVDIESFSGQQSLEEMQLKVERALKYFVSYCHAHGLAAKSYSAYGTDIIEYLCDIAEKVDHEFPNAIFFACRLVLERENWFTRLLHNETSVSLQRRLHAMGKQLILLPMKI